MPYQSTLGSTLGNLKLQQGQREANLRREQGQTSAALYQTYSQLGQFPEKMVNTIADWRDRETRNQYMSDLSREARGRADMAEREAADTLALESAMSRHTRPSAPLMATGPNQLGVNPEQGQAVIDWIGAENDLSGNGLGHLVPSLREVMNQSVKSVADSKRANLLAQSEASKAVTALLTPVIGAGHDQDYGVHQDQMQSVRPWESGRGSPLKVADPEGFQSWYSDIASKHDLNPDPDDPSQFYDYRSAFMDGVRGPASGGHWPSKYKLEGHPNMVVGGFHVQTGERVPGTPRASEKELIDLGWGRSDAERLSQLPDTAPDWSLEAESKKHRPMSTGVLTQRPIEEQIPRMQSLHGPASPTFTGPAQWHAIRPQVNEILQGAGLPPLPVEYDEQLLREVQSRAMSLEEITTQDALLMGRVADGDFDFTKLKPAIEFIQKYLAGVTDAEGHAARMTQIGEWIDTGVLPSGLDAVITQAGLWDYTGDYPDKVANAFGSPRTPQGPNKTGSRSTQTVTSWATAVDTANRDWNAIVDSERMATENLRNSEEGQRSRPAVGPRFTEEQIRESGLTAWEQANRSPQIDRSDPGMTGRWISTPDRVRTDPITGVSSGFGRYEGGYQTFDPAMSGERTVDIVLPADPEAESYEAETKAEQELIVTYNKRMLTVWNSLRRKMGLTIRSKMPSVNPGEVLVLMPDDSEEVMTSSALDALNTSRPELGLRVIFDPTWLGLGSLPSPGRSTMGEMVFDAPQ